MTHTQTILAKKLGDNGSVAVKLRCCDETRTDSWHTLYPLAGATQTDFDTWLTDRKAAVQASHESIIASQTFLATL